MPSGVECSRSTMQHIRQRILIMLCTVLCCVVSVGQELPTIASVADLSKNPRRFDSRLVQVRAWLAFGWEGDNFLFDSTEPEPHNMHSPHVWFYSKPDHERKVWDTIKFGGPPVLGTFTGYFHFVPDQKSRMKDVFDPGPLQLEVIGVFDLAPNAKPNTSGPATPHN
jgi:hypothetical protein